MLNFNKMSINKSSSGRKTKFPKLIVKLEDDLRSKVYFLSAKGFWQNFLSESEDGEERKKDGTERRGQRRKSTPKFSLFWEKIFRFVSPRRTGSPKHSGTRQSRFCIIYAKKASLCMRDFQNWFPFQAVTI